MGILTSFKSSENVSKLESKLRDVQAAVDRARAGRVETQAALTDVSDRLAMAELMQDSTVTALQTERSKLADRSTALDLAIARGDSDADLLRQRIAAESNEREREVAAARLESIAIELEKTLQPARKAAQALSSSYFAVPQIAFESTPGSTPQILSMAFPWLTDFIEGGALESLIAANRQVAQDILAGRRDPNIALTIGGKIEGMTGRKLSKTKVA